MISSENNRRLITQPIQLIENSQNIRINLSAAFNVRLQAEAIEAQSNTQLKERFKQI